MKSVGLILTSLFVPLDRDLWTFFQSFCEDGSVWIKSDSNYFCISDLLFALFNPYFSPGRKNSFGFKVNLVLAMNQTSSTLRTMSARQKPRTAGRGQEPGGKVRVAQRMMASISVKCVKITKSSHSTKLFVVRRQHSISVQTKFSEQCDLLNFLRGCKRRNLRSFIYYRLRMKVKGAVSVLFKSVGRCKIKLKILVQ